MHIAREKTHTSNHLDHGNRMLCDEATAMTVVVMSS